MITRAIGARIRPWSPALCVDADGGEGRRLRRQLRHVARDYVRALQVQPPRLVIVVQRVVVQDGSPLASLLEVFEDADGVQRSVIFLARSVAGAEIDDEALPALLRHQLEYALADRLGRLTFAAPLGLPQPVRHAPVPLRGRDGRDRDPGPPPDIEMLDAFDPAGEPEPAGVGERRTS